MNRNLHAVGVGLRRGWIEFVNSLKSPQDQGFYVFMGLGVLTFLWFNRNNEVEGTGLTLTTLAMPSILGGLIAFGVVIGPAYALAMEREDGTLLRSKAAPRGLIGYVTGQLFLQSLSLVPLLSVVLIPSLLLFDVVHRGVASWLTLLWVLVLGTLSVLPLGIIIGSLVPSAQKVGTWGTLPIMALVSISGIFQRVEDLWGWVQVVAQVFPVYWLALGMRSAFLPAEAAAFELRGSWETGATIAVLGAWAIAGALVAPVVLRRMAERQSGSAVEAARDAATQLIR